VTNDEHSGASLATTETGTRCRIAICRSVPDGGEYKWGVRKIVNKRYNMVRIRFSKSCHR